MASIQKRPDGRYRARYRDKTGKEHAKHFVRKVDAQRWLDEVTTALVTGSYVAPKAGRESVREYGERWRDRQLHRERTSQGVEAILRLHVYPELGDMPLETVVTGDIEALVRSWALSSSPATVETRFRILAAVFGSAVRDRRLPAARARVSGCQGSPHEERSRPSAPRPCWRFARRCRTTSRRS